MKRVLLFLFVLISLMIQVPAQQPNWFIPVRFDDPEMEEAYYKSLFHLSEAEVALFFEHITLIGELSPGHPTVFAYPGLVSFNRELEDFPYHVFFERAASMEGELTPGGALYRLISLRLLENPEADLRNEFGELMSLYPQTPMVRFFFMEYLIKNGDAEHALAVAKDLNVGFPDFFPVFKQLGYGNLEAGDFPKAKYFFTQYIKALPESADAHTCMGDYFVAENDPETAMEYYQKALKFNPDWASAKKGVDKAQSMLD
ncbi:MAG: hypothetical protein AAGI38_21825 [Bacteroidota bacterium]